MVKHKVGTLAAGESKKIELELTAREAGELKIQARRDRRGRPADRSDQDGALPQGGTAVDWRGPDKKFAGAVATYFLRVRNPGTAAADSVAVKVNLPAGAELVEGQRRPRMGRRSPRAVSWKPASLNAGEERFMEVAVPDVAAGRQQDGALAQTANGDLSDVKSVPVTVEALADLKLEVSRSQGGRAGGRDGGLRDSHPEPRHDRGQGRERRRDVLRRDRPLARRGRPAHDPRRPGHVPHDRQLAAGGETVLRIHAKASKSGTHVFRAEVACEELEAKLAAEETTRFFTEEERWADASTAYADEAGHDDAVEGCTAPRPLALLPLVTRVSKLRRLKAWRECIRRLRSICCCRIRRQPATGLRHQLHRVRPERASCQRRQQSLAQQLAAAGDAAGERQGKLADRRQLLRQRTRPSSASSSAASSTIAERRRVAAAGRFGHRLGQRGDGAADVARLFQRAEHRSRLDRLAVA